MSAKTNQSYPRQVAYTEAAPPSDSVDLQGGVTRAIYVGVSGDVVVTYANGTSGTIVGLAAGIFHPIQVARIKSTSTTATSILAAY